MIERGDRVRYKGKPATVHWVKRYSYQVWWGNLRGILHYGLQFDCDPPKQVTKIDGSTGFLNLSVI